MAGAIPIDVPVVTWSRANSNRYKTWFLAALTLMALTPFVIGLSCMIASTFFSAGTRYALAEHLEIRREEKALQAATNMDSETRRNWERILQSKRAALDADPEGMSRFIESVTLLSLAQCAALALMFWSIASSPTSKLLVEAGAVPAGPAEQEARQLLESLAFSAGLPPPKLYIIESSAPNAFAAALAPDQYLVTVSRGLLQLLDREELEGVFAHELSHIGNQDVNLNATVAAIALFLRIPYLLFRRQLQAAKRLDNRPRRNPWRLLLSPMGIYILVVAPILGGALRAAVSRRREFLADADAAELNGSPKGILRALAKIGGAGSVIPGINPAFAHYYFCNPSASTAGIGGSLVSTHPTISDRVERLAALAGAPSVDVMKEAIETGRRYQRVHPATETLPVAAGHDELASLNRGNPMGRVYRLIANDSVSVYEVPSTSSAVLARLKPGSLLVAFDDPGKMRQINTPQQTFGYIDRGARLMLMDDIIPAEIYDSTARALVEAKLPPLGVVTNPVVPRNLQKQNLSVGQILAVIALAVTVFAGVFLVLLKFGH